MAKRLIDADKLIEKAIKEKRFIFSNHDVTTDETIIKTVYKDLADFIQSIPAVDAVEVVRCRECAWYDESGRCTNSHCTKSYYGCRVPKQHYCSYGERRTDGNL